MVMKDKLVKTHHKASYYIFRKAFLFSMIFASVVIGASVTTYISLSSTAKAEEKENTTVEVVESEDSSELESFEDSNN